MPPPFTVYVDDNFHYQDEEHRYCLGEFGTEQEAVTVCREHIGRELRGMHKPGMPAKELYDLYVGFGEDPWAVGLDFSAWDYAKMFSRQVVGEKRP